MAKQRLPPSWSSKSYLVIICHRVPNVLLCTKFHQNRMRLFFIEICRFNDFCNIAHIGHLEISKFRVYVTWPISSCCSVSLCKVSLKSDYNWLLSYGQKRFLKRRPSAILNFRGHMSVTEFRMCIYVPNFIKIGCFFVEIWRFDNFQDGAPPSSWIWEVQ